MSTHPISSESQKEPPHIPQQPCGKLSGSDGKTHKVQRSGQGKETAVANKVTALLGQTGVLSYVTWRAAHWTQQMPSMEQFACSLCYIPSVLATPFSIANLAHSVRLLINAKSHTERFKHTIGTIDRIRGLGMNIVGLATILQNAKIISTNVVAWIPPFLLAGAAIQAITLGFDIHAAVKTGKLYQSLAKVFELCPKISEKTPQPPITPELAQALGNVFSELDKKLGTLTAKLYLSKDSKLQEKIDEIRESVHPAQALETKILRYEKSNNN